MAWKVEISKKAKKKISEMAAEPKKQILDFICNSISKFTNPRSEGKPLVGNLKGYHSYRTGNYRIICTIKDELLLVKIVNVAHRKEVYCPKFGRKAPCFQHVVLTKNSV